MSRSGRAQVTLRGQSGRDSIKLLRWIVRVGLQILLRQALPLLPLLGGYGYASPPLILRRNTIVQPMRGELTADRGADVSAALVEQLLAIVTEQCATIPTVLVVDDLQWADPASVTLWERLARSVRQVPLLLVGMMRPVPLHVARQIRDYVGAQRPRWKIDKHLGLRPPADHPLGTDPRSASDHVDQQHHAE